MLPFCYLRQYLGIETVLIAYCYGDKDKGGLKPEKLGQFFK